jgi:flagellar biosynthesis protein FliR
MNGLLVQLTALAGLTDDMLRPAVLVFLRVGALMALLPAFGEKVVPQRVRLVLTLAFCAVVAPAVADRYPGSDMLLPAGAEVAAGLLVGMGLRLMVLALQTGGAIAAQSTSLAQMFPAMGAEPQPAIGLMLSLGGMALAVQAGLHVQVAALLIRSYDILPAGRFPVAVDVAQWGLAQTVQAFSLAFTLAAPFVIASVIYNLALGVINRAMPQLMVSFVGAPALALGSLVLMAVASPLALLIWLRAFHAYIAAPFAVSP